MPSVPLVKNETAFSPTFHAVSWGMIYWLIKKISPIPKIARIINFTKKDTGFCSILYSSISIWYIVFARYLVYVYFCCCSHRLGFPAAYFLQPDHNLPIRFLILMILHACRIHHSLGCDHTDGIGIFIIGIDHFPDSALYDCLCTFITRK